MALSTRTIQDSINWAKRMSFNRNPVIGNSLEPALTSASLVMQAILSPPFEWWWNNVELSFTCSPTASVATSTAISIVAGVVTVTAPNNFSVSSQVLVSGITGSATALNGKILTLLTASATQFTANINLPNVSDTVGTFTNVTIQDYTVPLSQFSHVEHASVLDLDSNNAPVKWYELTVENELSLESSQGRPQFISPYVEDGNGNMTFRIFPSPDKPYPISAHVQQSAPAITSVNQTWAPLPDFMQYVYDWGFLAFMWFFADDNRAQYAEGKFKAALLGRSQGLTEEEKNIFLNNWEELKAGYLLKMQQGIQARAS